MEPRHDPISVPHLLRLLHWPEAVLNDYALRLPLA